MLGWLYEKLLKERGGRKEERRRDRREGGREKGRWKGEKGRVC